ncbi:hypothetical protein PG985_000828 [Apiospora marii]|uniref:uncharacterized protein n=1 Tax=Apiospora marii TaxID=335849 RepID=UPI00312EADE6
MDIPSSPHDDDNNQTADFVVYDDQHDDIPAPSSGPCMVCGRISDFPSPFKENAFECEFLCGWPVPRDIRERLRRVKEQEERRDAESHGYDADDEQEDGGQDTSEGTISLAVNVNNNNLGDETDGLSSQAPATQNILDHHDEDSPMRKTSTYTGKCTRHSFPNGVPSPPTQPKTPPGTANRALGHDDLQLASSGKRKPKDGDESSKDRPAKKQKIAGGPSGTVSKDPMDYFRLGGRHNLLGFKAKPSLADVLFGYHGDER